MPIVIELPDDFFTDDERQKLKDLFKTQDDAEFSEALQKVLRAALSEYKDMFLGMGLPSRADEIQQHRLFHLIKHCFCGMRIMPRLCLNWMQRWKATRSLPEHIHARVRTPPLAAVETQVGQAAELWGIMARELQEMRRSLAELG